MENDNEKEIYEEELEQIDVNSDKFNGSFHERDSLSENNIVKDVKFDGEACAISTSATSIMIKLLVGKTITEAKELINNYFNCLTTIKIKVIIIENIIPLASDLIFRLFFFIKKPP